LQDISSVIFYADITYVVPPLRVVAFYQTTGFDVWFPVVAVEFSVSYSCQEP